MSKSWQLAEGYKIQYFYPRKNLAKLLRDMGDFVEESGAEVQAVSLDSGYDEDRRVATFAANIIYTGGNDA